MKKNIFLINAILFCCYLSIANAEPQCGIITDMNGDKKTGLEEAIYALQVVAGIKGECNNDEIEPNDTLSQANTIGLNEQIVGKIIENGDEDYFQFTTQEPGVIELTVNPVPSSFEMGATLYDSQQNIIASQHASEPGKMIFLTKLGYAGVYYLRLEDSIPIPGPNSGSDEYYYLQIQLDASDSHEINNSFAIASTIALNAEVSGKIYDDEDRDYFKFSTNAGLIEIAVDPIPYDAVLSARLYDYQQNIIDDGYSSEAGNSIFFDVEVDAGVHYLTIEGLHPNKSSKEAYTLKVKQ